MSDLRDFPRKFRRMQGLEIAWHSLSPFLPPHRQMNIPCAPESSPAKLCLLSPIRINRKNQTTWLAQSEKFIVGNWQLLCHANRLRLTPEPGLLSPDQVCDEAKDSGKHGWPAAERCCHVVCLIVHLPHAL